MNLSLVFQTITVAGIRNSVAIMGSALLWAGNAIVRPTVTMDQMNGTVSSSLKCVYTTIRLSSFTFVDIVIYHIGLLLCIHGCNLLKNYVMLLRNRNYWYWGFTFSSALAILSILFKHGSIYKFGSIYNSGAAFTTGEVACTDNQFACPATNTTTMKCISRRWLCDGESDCPGGEDETDCTGNTCASDAFTCADQACISHRWKCDGDADCKDGSDEQDCQPSPTDSSAPVTMCTDKEFAVSISSVTLCIM